jgi:hypothetical protein
MTESSSDDGMTGPLTGSSAGTGSSSTGMPMPCLDIGPMTETATVDSTGTDDTGTDTTETDATGTDATDDDGTTTGG